MTIQTIANTLIGVALVGWIVYRQLTWRVVSISRMWRLPLIMGGVGIVMLAQTKDATRISAIDLAVLIVELVVSLGVGALMGRIAVFRPRTIRPGGPGDPLGRGGMRGSRDDRRRNRGDRRATAPERHLNVDGTETVLETRTGWLGLVLWIVLIGVRVGVDAMAMNMGAVVVTATGVILLMIAANRLARVFVFAARVQTRDAVTA